VITGKILIKIESPYYDEAGWCMFMGSAGEVFGLLVYLGDEGYSNHHDLQISGRMQAPVFESHNCFFSQ